MKIYDYNGQKNICSERIYVARNRIHLTQKELASRLQEHGVNLERDSISRMELGIRFVADYELRALACVLEVSPAWLLGMEPLSAIMDSVPTMWE